MSADAVGPTEGFTMPYAFRQGRSVESEIRRIADKQLTLAIAHMRATGDRQSDEAVHEARRHVKKVRALLRLVRPALAGLYRSSNRRLRKVSRLLAPIADGEAVIGTLTRMGARYHNDIPHRSFVKLRSALVRRSQDIDRAARSDRILQRGVKQLQAERSDLQVCSVEGKGFQSISDGLFRTIRRARRGMETAHAHPTAANYHVWRGRVKDHWFQVRLIEPCCGGHLADDERTLERLDDALGEHHNCVLVQQAIVTDARLPRHDAARLLRALRAYRNELRREAARLAADLYTEAPRQTLQRVQRLWRDTDKRVHNLGPDAEVKVRWAPAA
jgi:CHAD domain-containing protein